MLMDGFRFFRWLGRPVIGLLLGLALVTGCASVQNDTGAQDLNGRILLWHAWPEGESKVLEAIVARFQEAHPDVLIKTRGFDSEREMLRTFTVAAKSGLGPDVLIASNDSLHRLINEDLIVDISAELSEDEWARYIPKTVEALSVGDKIYGIPESQNTMVLFYNRALADEPPATLDDLIIAAEEGEGVLVNSGFIDAFWGVQAFGGALFDDDGRVILDRGGFVNWLAWLVEARDRPGIILDTDRAALRNRFVNGRASYYIGDSNELSLITEKMGEDAVGVAPLPGGPLGPAGPFLGVRAFLVSAVASDSARELAVEFAQFATNAEQNAILMRELQHVPVNAQVRLNPRLDPVVGAVTQQARNAVPMPATDNMQTVLDLAQDSYSRVLEGDVGPVQAAVETTRSVNRANGFVDETAPMLACDVGSVRLLNAWPHPYADALEQIVEEFREECPTIIVTTARMDPGDVRILPDVGTVSLARFDLIAGPQQLLADLALPEKLRRIDAYVDPQTLQRYRPLAVQAMVYDDGLYGIPAYIVLDALYFNKSLVEDAPALSVTDLRIQAQNGVPIQLEVGFVPGMWGVGAFGGEIWDERYDLDALEEGLAAWLAWLAETRDATSLTLVNDRASLFDAFLDGETAYLVAEPARWFELEGELGDNLGLTLLPSDLGGSAKPLAGVSGFMLPASVSEDDVDLALRFIAFATASERTELTSGSAATLPAATVVDDVDQKPLSVYVQQASAAALIPTAAEWPAMVEIGDHAYAGALNDGVDPALAARTVISGALSLFGQPAPSTEPVDSSQK